MDAYGFDDKAREKAELEVWGAASTEFMKAKFQELVTSVCAADPDRVFRAYEIKAILDNPRIKRINNRSAALFKAFHKIHPYEAYRLFCLTELHMARQRAEAEKTKEAWDDWRGDRQRWRRRRL
jgi:hypothetical protein